MSILRYGAGSGNFTLKDAHDILQIIMGRDDYHLHQFQIGGRMYGVTHLDTNETNWALARKWHRTTPAKRSKTPRSIKPLKVAFGSSLRRFADASIPVWITQLALEDLAAGLAGQRIEEFDLLRHLEVGQPLAQVTLHRAGRQHRSGLRFDARAQP